MPSSTFFNLPDEKREKLINAIKQEMARAPFEEVSINRIIAAAQIPRGSYYQYFKDKEDMLEYMLQSFKARLLEFIEYGLKEGHRDLFSSMKSVLDYFISIGTDSENSKIIRNIFSRFRLQEKLFFNESSIAFKQQLYDIYDKYADKSGLNIESGQDFACMLEILQSQVIFTAAMIFKDMENKDKYYKDFCSKLEILKRGMAKPAQSITEDK